MIQVRKLRIYVLQLSAEGFGGSDAPKQVQGLHFYLHSFKRTTL